MQRMLGYKLRGVAPGGRGFGLGAGLQGGCTEGEGGTQGSRAKNRPGSPVLQGMQRPCASRCSSMVSSFTLTSRIGYTCGRMRLLKPHAPTWVAPKAVRGPGKRRIPASYPLWPGNARWLLPAPKQLGVAGRGSLG